MVGGLINIVSYGVNDLYLTGDPQITFFKKQYKRYTHFAIESIKIPFESSIKLGEEYNILIPKSGDLLSNMYLQIELPEISIPKYALISDITNKEALLLVAPTQITSPINYTTDYENVKKFMELNTAWYRTAYDNKDVYNQTTLEYCETILNSILDNENLSNIYNSTLTTAFNYELSQGKDPSLLDYRTSNIYYIINTINDNLSIETVFKLIENAISVSVKVCNYYFQNAQSLIAQSNTLAKFAWMEKIGLALFEYVEILIGGESIDKHYSSWMNIWYYLTRKVSMDTIYNKMIGNVSTLTTFNNEIKPKYQLTIPLYFWFCLRIGSAFPLIALQYNDISLNVKFRTLDECAIIEELPSEYQNRALRIQDIWNKLGYIINANLMMDVVFLDTNERQTFAQSQHEYLINVMHQVTQNTTQNNNTISLDFVGVSKEIIWTIQKDVYINNTPTLYKYPFKYEHVDRASLTLNSQVLFEKEGQYFEYIQPYSHHTRIPENIGLYSFSLFPEQYQPSASCNFNLIKSPLLTVNLNSTVFEYNLNELHQTNINTTDETDVTINVYSVKQNILRIVNGMASLAFK